MGIPRDVLPKIFDPFFSTKPKGHGLGLATCHSIIKRHGGFIDVSSEPGKGSTFSVYLPASLEAAAMNTAGAAASPKDGGSILIMDDEEIIRETMEAMLNRLGYTAHCVSDVKEALRLFEQKRSEGGGFAALILDLTIPGGPGGKEAILDIRRIDKEIPVFVASGYADDPVMARPADFGFTASISKPFTKTELADILKKHLKR